MRFFKTTIKYDYATTTAAEAYKEPVSTNKHDKIAVSFRLCLYSAHKLPHKGVLQSLHTMSHSKSQYYADDPRAMSRKHNRTVHSGIDSGFLWQDQMSVPVRTARGRTGTYTNL